MPPRAQRRGRRAQGPPPPLLLRRRQPSSSGQCYCQAPLASAKRPPPTSWHAIWGASIRACQAAPLPSDPCPLSRTPTRCTPHPRLVPHFPSSARLSSSQDNGTRAHVPHKPSPAHMQSHHPSPGCPSPGCPPPPRYDVLELNASDTRSRAQLKASLLPVIGSQVLCFGRGAALPRAGAGSGGGGGGSTGAWVVQTLGGGFGSAGLGCFGWVGVGR